MFVKIKPLRLAGRCLDGAERDGGRLFHAVPVPITEDDKAAPRTATEAHLVELANYGVALCGAKPGRQSVGWSAHGGDEVTCKRCLKKLGAQ